MSGQTRRHLADTAQTLLVLAILAVFMFPVVWLLLTSVKLDREVNSVPVVWIPSQLYVGHYARLLGLGEGARSAPFVTYLQHSLVVAVGSSLLALAVGTMAGYAFGKYRFRARRSLFVLVLVMRVVPGIALSLPLLMLLKNVGLVNSMLGLILVYVALNAPFVAWLTEGFFRETPAELTEQALVDGASKWQAFLRVDLPLAAPGLAASFLFAFILAWNEFHVASVLAPGTASRTVAVGLYDYIGEFYTDWGGMTAAGALTVVPAVILVFFLQRYIVRGLTFGALK